MKIKFTEQEIQSIRDIIEEYRTVSDELYSNQKKANEFVSSLSLKNDAL